MAVVNNIRRIIKNSLSLRYGCGGGVPPTIPPEGPVGTCVGVNGV